MVGKTDRKKEREFKKKEREKFPMGHVMMYCLLCGAVNQKERSQWPSQPHHSPTPLFYTTLTPDPLMSRASNCHHMATNFL